KLVGRVLCQAVADGIIPANPTTLAPPPRSTRKASPVLSPWGGHTLGAACGRSGVGPRRGRVTVARALSEVRGHITEGLTKSGKVRTVTMPKIVSEALSDYMGRHPGELIFTAPDGGYIRRTNWRRRVW